MTILAVAVSVNALTGRNDSDTYDNLGNRATSVHNGDTTNYTVNELNQYTSRDIDDTFDVAGSAPTGSTVTVAGAATTRHGEYYFKGHDLVNTNPISASLSIAISGSGSISLDAFLRGDPESRTHDEDGNLKEDGRWKYTYDAENRLIMLETQPDVITHAGLAKRRIEFTYDYLGRRVRQIDYDWDPSMNGGAGGWDHVDDRRFIYDGWQQIAEYWGSYSSGNFVYTNSRFSFWGLDITGSLSAAGGVGGLLAVQEGSDTYFPIYDGLGNVHGMIEDGGTVEAIYEYDAFGRTLREEGFYAADNPFRFSTKYTDNETALVYYGRRYYDPKDGRFVGRDPIEEQGGLNLYAFVTNGPVNRWDYLGMNEDGALARSLSPEAYSNYIKQLKHEARVRRGADFLRARSAISLASMRLQSLAFQAERGRERSMAEQIQRARLAQTEQNGGSNPSSNTTTSVGNAGVSSSGSALGDVLEDIPLVGGLLGGAADIATGVVETAVGAVTLGQSGTLSSGVSNIGSGLLGAASGAVDIAGKVWNSPNTAIGVVVGTVGVVAGTVMDTDPGIDIGNNAIQFTGIPFGQPGAMTLGNTQLYHEADPSEPVPRYDSTGTVNLGAHEEAHTYQSEVLGPLFLPVYFLNGGISQHNPFEEAADDFAEGSGSWWPGG